MYLNFGGGKRSSIKLDNILKTVSIPLLPLTVRHRSTVRHPGRRQVWTRWRPPPCSCASHRRRWAPRSRCGRGRSCGTTWGWGPRSEPGCSWPGCNRRTGHTWAARARPAAPGTSGSPLTSLYSHPLQRDTERERDTFNNTLHKNVRGKKLNIKGNKIWKIAYCIGFNVQIPRNIIFLAKHYFTKTYQRDEDYLLINHPQ